MNSALLILVADSGIQVEWGPWHGLIAVLFLLGIIGGSLWFGSRASGQSDRGFNDPQPPTQL